MGWTTLVGISFSRDQAVEVDCVEDVFHGDHEGLFKLSFGVDCWVNRPFLRHVVP